MRPACPVRTIDEGRDLQQRGMWPPHLRRSIQLNLENVPAAMRSLEVEPQKTEPGRICLLLTGELNAFTTDLLTTGIDRAVRDAGDSMATVTATVTAPVIVLDIGGVRFLDSAGIR